MYDCWHFWAIWSSFEALREEGQELLRSGRWIIWAFNLFLWWYFDWELFLEYSLVIGDDG